MLLIFYYYNIGQLICSFIFLRDLHKLGLYSSLRTIILRHIRPHYFVKILFMAESDCGVQSRTIRWRRNISVFVKKFVAFLFSHVGLTCVVIGYAIFGAFLFKKIEAPNEQRVRDEIASKRAKLVEELWNTSLKAYTSQLNDRQLNFSGEVEVLLNEFHDFIVNKTKTTGWDGLNNDTHPKWSFAGGLLYAVTVITTIGYGHLVPQTYVGRFVTILYAIIGIPLTLLCLSNIGQFLGGFFSIIYRLAISHIFRLLALIFLPRKSAFNRKIGTELMGMKTRVDNEVLVQQQDNDLLEYDSELDDEIVDNKIVLSLVNDRKTNQLSNGPAEVVDRGYRGSNKPLIGISEPSVWPNSLGQTEQGKNAYYRERFSGEVSNDSRKKGRSFGRRNTLIAAKRLASVPIPMALLVIVCYIIAGAIIFSRWEAWNFLIGMYFCFTTLTTIGLGDFVPGVSEVKENWEKTILCVVYLLVGLALSAMCYHLVQLEVRTKLRRLAIKIGIET